MIKAAQISQAAIAGMPTQATNHKTMAVIYDPVTGEPTALSVGLKRQMLKNLHRARYQRRYARHRPAPSKTRRANRYQPPGPSLRDTRYPVPFDLTWLKEALS